MDSETAEALDPLGMMNMLSSYSVSALIAGTVFSIIGIWMFRVAKKRANNTCVVISLVLMFYPFFVTVGWQCWAIGIALCAAAYAKWDA